MPRTRQDRIAFAVIAVVVLLSLWQVSATVLATAAALWWLLPIAAAVAGLAWAGRGLHRVRAGRARAARLEQLRLPLAQLDVLHPTAFEHAVRDLMIRDGIRARHVGQQGDQAADAIGRDRAGRVFVAQCKHTTVGGKVGVQVMYQVKGTAGPVHGAHVAFVVTNGSFTRDARAWGDRHAVHWVDRRRLQAWAESGASLYEVLQLPSRAIKG